MPGLMGYVYPHRGEGAERARRVFEGALDPQECEPLKSTACRVLRDDGLDGRYAIARRHLGVFGIQAAAVTGAPAAAIVHGELYTDSGELAANGAEVVSQRYLDQGLGFLTGLRGAFCAVIVDRKSQIMHLVNDRLGSYPLYWTEYEDGFYFAPDVITARAFRGNEGELDLTALAEFLRFGFVGDDRTLCESVKLLPPGTVFSVSLSEARYRRWTYASPSTWFVSEPGHTDPEPAKSAFREAVSRATSGELKLGMSLSGGLDSRAILAAAHGRAGQISTYTCGLPGCADQAIGARLAAVAGTQHHFLPHQEQVLDDVRSHMSNMVRMCDGMYLSHGVTEIHDLANLRPVAPQVLLRGHGGELAKMALAWPFHADKRVQTAVSVGEIADSLYERVNFVSDLTRLRLVMSDDLASNLDSRSRSAFNDMLSIADLGPIEACSYLYLFAHHRRFTVASLQMFRRVSEIRMPFVDESFLRELFRLDPRARITTHLHRALIGEDAPALGRIRDANTGTSATAGAIRRFVFDKANTALARLRVPGFRHYHHFDEVFRRVLIEQVEEVLLDPGVRLSALIERPRLERALTRARAGHGDMGHLLQGLLGVELWLQQGNTA